jgi:hypothetical protein
MKLLKTKQPQKEASSDASLAEQLRAARQAAEAFIEAEAQRIKASPDGQSLPISWLRSNIFAVHKAHGCACRCALSLMSSGKPHE